MDIFIIFHLSFNFFQHLIKKIRNGLMKSIASNQGTKFLQRNGHCILWDNWQEAETWDAEYNVGHRLHHKLTQEKLDVNRTSKMRNSFANLALNRDMYHLLKVNL